MINKIYEVIIGTLKDILDGEEEFEDEDLYREYEREKYE